MVLMTSQAPQHCISFWKNCCFWFVIFVVCAHTSVDVLGLRTPVVFDPHLGVCMPCCWKWGFLLQALCSVCLLTLMWLCSGLTKAMLTLCEIHLQGLWAGLWQGQAVRVHPSNSNCLLLGPTQPSQTWAGLFQPLCWRAHKDTAFNQTRQGLFNRGLCLLANPTGGWRMWNMGKNKTKPGGLHTTAQCYVKHC